MADYFIVIAMNSYIELTLKYIEQLQNLDDKDSKVHCSRNARRMF